MSDLRKLFKYFNGTTIVWILSIPFAPSVLVFCNNLALCLKDLKPVVYTILALKSVALSSE